MKKIILFFVLVSMFKLMNCNELYDAVNSSDVSGTKKLLQQHEVTQKEKQELLKVACYKISEWESKSNSFMDSKEDMIQFLAGVGLTASGTWLTRESLSMFVPALAVEQWGVCKGCTDVVLGVAILGIATGLIGTYNVVKGWRMSSANFNLKRAKKVKELILNASVLDDNLTDTLGDSATI